MEDKNIPSFFWYCLSICMVAATFGLLYLGFLSSSISIEVADTKIEMKKAFNEIKAARVELTKKEAEILSKEKIFPDDKKLTSFIKPQSDFSFKGGEFKIDYKDLDKSINSIEEYLYKK